MTHMQHENKNQKGTEPMNEKTKYLNVKGYSDVNPYEVIEASSNLKTLKVKPLHAERTNADKDVHTAGGFCCHTDNPDGQKWKFTSIEDACIEIYTLRKNGRYVRKGSAMPSGLSFTGKLSDTPYKYYDYNF